CRLFIDYSPLADLFMINRLRSGVFGLIFPEF
ncbi:MAG: hypothetical protein ACI9A2_002376, partial [Halioglobus sp.]